MKPGSLREDHEATLAAARTLTERRIWMAKDALRDPDLTKAERAELEALIAEEHATLDELQAAEADMAVADYSNPTVGRDRDQRAARKRRKRIERKADGRS